MKNILICRFRSGSVYQDRAVWRTWWAPCRKCFDKEYFDVRVMIPKYLCIKESFRNDMTNI